MARTIALDPTQIPRPFALVARLWEMREGTRITREGVQQIHDRAIRKLRAALCEGDFLETKEDDDGDN